jgi:hypothetical protein
MENFYMGCAICGRPLRLEEAHAEDGGLPVHEECYVIRLKQSTTKQDRITE